MSIDNVVEKIEFTNPDYDKYIKLLKPYHEKISSQEIISPEKIEYVHNIAQELLNRYTEESLELTNILRYMGDIVSFNNEKLINLKIKQEEKEYKQLFDKIMDESITEEEEKRFDRLHLRLYAGDQ